MRTLLVNPARRTASKTRASKPSVIVVRNASAPVRRRRRRRNADLVANPKRRASRVVVVNPRRRRRRGSNPQQLIIPNGRRRRRRRNPEWSLKAGLMTVALGTGAALASYVANRYVIANLFYKTDQHWNSDDNRRGVLMRVGVRTVLGALAAFLVPGAIGASLNGAMMYPAVSELHAWWENRRSNTAANTALTENANPFNPYPSQPTSADFLEADLAQAFGY